MMNVKLLFAFPLMASALSAQAELPVWLSIDAGMAGPGGILGMPAHDPGV